MVPGDYVKLNPNRTCSCTIGVGALTLIYKYISQDAYAKGYWVLESMTDGTQFSTMLCHMMECNREAKRILIQQAIEGIDRDIKELTAIKVIYYAQIEILAKYASEDEEINDVLTKMQASLAAEPTSVQSVIHRMLTKDQAEAV